MKRAKIRLEERPHIPQKITKAPNLQVHLECEFRQNFQHSSQRHLETSFPGSIYLYALPVNLLQLCEN